VWQGYSGAAGYPVEVECSENEMEADLLGNFLKNFIMDT